MSLLSKIKPNGPSGFGYGTTAEQVTQGFNLSQKTILITGCNSGIGLESLRVLAMRGAHIIACARTEEKAAQAAKSVGAELLCTPVACELSEPDSIRAAIDKIRSLGCTLDALMLNAGIMALPRCETHHGLELQFLTNHVGHFLLTEGLLDMLADDGRVIAVSSEAHRNTVRGGINLDNLDGSRGYNGWQFYGQSKLANILFARELANRLQGTNKAAFSLHPGVIKTNLYRHTNPVLRTSLLAIDALGFKSIPEGAATQCYLATFPGLNTASGQYFSHCNRKKPSRYGLNDELARSLWQKTEEIVANLS